MQGDGSNNRGGRQSGQAKSLTVFTDCMTLLQIVTLWTRGDFTPYEEDEQHWDILSVLLQGLRERTAAGSQTLIVWVKAHVGDIGNEGADQAADRGCRSDDIQYDLITYPFRIYNIHTDYTISMHGWANKATTHEREAVGRHTRA
eukprot:2032927-Rhodomonas_salina.2